MMYIVKKHWIPSFPSVLLGDLLLCDIERFMEHLSEIRRGNDQPLSNVRKNSIIKACTIPLRWAYRKGKIGQDITRGLMLFSGKSRERLILIPQLASSIFNQEWADERSKVANMTAMVTGLRSGDLGEDCLLVRHSWNRADKLKLTKNNTERVVELPFPSVLHLLKYIASLNPQGIGFKNRPDPHIIGIFFSQVLKHKIEDIPSFSNVNFIKMSQNLSYGPNLVYGNFQMCLDFK